MGYPGSQAPGRGSRLRAAAARRLNYASQPAPQQPRAPAPRPPAGSRLLIAALAGPRCRPFWWPRYLGADALTARTAGSRMGALKGERSGGGWRPARARRCLQPRPAMRGRPRPLQLEDAPQRQRSAGRARRTGLPLVSPARRAARSRALRRATRREASAGCGSHAPQCGFAVSAARRAAAGRARSPVLPCCGAGCFHARLCSPLSLLL